MRIAGCVLAIAALSSCGHNPFVGKETYLKRGRQFAAEGKYADAELQFRKALQKDNSYGDACLEYGRLLIQQGRPVEAFRSLTLAVQLMPNSESAKVQLGRLAVSALLADPKRSQYLYDAASKMANQLLARDPNSFEGLRLKGYLASADAHAKEAIDSFRKALQAKPHEPDVATMLVQTLFLDHQDTEAEAVATRELAVVKNYGPLYDALSAFYVQQRRNSAVEQLLKQKIASNPGQAFFVIQLADHYRVQNQLAEMNSAVEGLISRYREVPHALQEAGDFYEGIGEVDKALAIYQKGAANDPTLKKEYLRRIIGIRINQNRLPEATAAVDALLKEFPNDLKALVARADLRMASGKPEEMRRALAEFADLVQKAPDDVDVRYSQARAYRLLNQDTEAKAALQEVLRRSPMHRDALREMADLAIRAQDSEQALEYSQKLIDLDPNNTGARLVRTAAWALRGRFSEVRGELRRLTQESPALPEPWLQMATLEMEQKNYAEAERILLRFYRPDAQDIRPSKLLAGLYLAQGQSPKAMNVARQAAKANLVDGRILLASTAARTGDYSTAISVTQGLAADFPENPGYLLSIGVLYQQTGKLDPAIATFEKARQVAPDNALTHGYLGVALGQAGRYREAIAAIRQGLKLQPSNPMMMNNLAWNLALAGTNLGEAETLAKQATQLSPNDPTLVDTLGMVYLKSHKLENALSTFETLLRKEPANPTYEIHCALVLIELRQNQRARAQLQAALKNRPSSADAEEAANLLKQLP